MGSTVTLSAMGIRIGTSSDSSRLHDEQNRLQIKTLPQTEMSFPCFLVADGQGGV